MEYSKTDLSGLVAATSTFTSQYLIEGVALSINSVF